MADEEEARMDRRDSKVLSDMKKSFMEESYKSEHFTDEMIQSFKEAFIVIDVDESGTINSSELGTLMRSLGQNPTEDELMEMINNADHDGSGTLDFPEFVDMMAKMLSEDDEEEKFREAFRVFAEKDGDNRGLIMTAELRHTMMYLKEAGQLDDEDVEELIHELDQDGDGVITYHEFLTMMSWKS